MAKKVELSVGAEQAGMRLDLFLAFNLAEYSRTNIKKLIEQNSVSVNGSVEFRANYKMVAGDIVTIGNEQEIVQRESMAEYKLEIPILYKDEDIVIVDKPTGLNVHPIREGDNKSLLNALQYTLKDQISSYGVSLVNRIDKGTSGLVVVALSPHGAWYYSKLFASGKAKKEYLAIVSGSWISKYGRTEKRIGNLVDFDHANKVQAKSIDKGSYAETVFKLIRQVRGLALLSAKPLTGKKHQIRLHSQQLGFPIVGDTLYGGVPAARLMLHAFKLSLKKPDGKEIVVESSVPQTFADLLTQTSV